MALTGWYPTLPVRCSIWIELRSFTLWYRDWRIFVLNTYEYLWLVLGEESLEHSSAGIAVNGNQHKKRPLERIITHIEGCRAMDGDCICVQPIHHGSSLGCHRPTWRPTI